MREDFESIGKKTRDILWRKVYYDPISISKKLWKSQSGQLAKDEVALLTTFIKVSFEDWLEVHLRIILIPLGRHQTLQDPHPEI